MFSDHVWDRNLESERIPRWAKRLVYSTVSFRVPYVNSYCTELPISVFKRLIVSGELQHRTLVNNGKIIVRCRVSIPGNKRTETTAKSALLTSMKPSVFTELLHHGSILSCKEWHNRTICVRNEFHSASLPNCGHCSALSKHQTKHFPVSSLKALFNFKALTIIIASNCFISIQSITM